MKTINKILTGIAGTILGAYLLASPVKADEVKSIRYNDQCTATYSLNEPEDRYNIFKVECDNGTKLYNPNGDSIIDKICDKEGCYENNKENEGLYGFFNSAIEPNGAISNAIMTSELERITKSLESLHENQPKTDLNKIGDW